MIKHRIRVGDVFGPVVNWKHNFEMTVGYKTAIQTFRSGIEQRRGLLTEPRLSFTFTAHFMGRDAEDFISEWYRDTTKIWYLPVPFREARVEQSYPNLVDPQLNQIEYDGVPPFWIGPDADLIVQTMTTRELVRVVSIEPYQPLIPMVPEVPAVPAVPPEEPPPGWDEDVDGPFVGDPGSPEIPAVPAIPEVPAVPAKILLDRDLTALANGGRVFAALPIQLNDKPTITMLTNDVYQMKVNVSAVAGEINFPIRAATHRSLFLTYPVFLKQHNWRSSASVELLPRLQTKDFGYGRRSRKMMDDFVASSYKCNFSIFDFTQVEEMLSFIHYLKGQLKPFWYPEWGELLDPNFPAQGNIRNRYFTSNQYLARSYSGSRTHRNIFIEYRNRNYDVRPVTGLNALDHSISYSVNSTQALNANNLKQVLWLCLYRLAADDITFSFKSSSVAEVTVPLRMMQTREVQV